MAEVEKVGDYSLLVGGSTVAFYPLDPKAPIAFTSAPQSGPVAPSNPNKFVVAPKFSVADILIGTGPQPLQTSKDSAAPALLTEVSGVPTAKSAPLVVEGDNLIRICFAVALSGTPPSPFQGT